MAFGFEEKCPGCNSTIELVMDSLIPEDIKASCPKCGSEVIFSSQSSMNVVDKSIDEDYEANMKEIVEKLTNGMYFLDHKSNKVLVTATGRPALSRDGIEIVYERNGDDVSLGVYEDASNDGKRKKFGEDDGMDLVKEVSLKLMADMLAGDSKCSISIGSKVVKVNGEENDKHKDGKEGTVVGNMMVPKNREKDPFFKGEKVDELYLVCFDGENNGSEALKELFGLEKTPAFVIGNKIRKIEHE
jgi:hypothetical protein